MRISELAETTAVPVHTLKFYLREGVLHPGHATSRTRADYDVTHVDRVRLVRALVEHGGLTIDRVRRVVSTLEAPPPSRHELLGIAAATLEDREIATDAVPDDVRIVLEDLGWAGCADGPLARTLARRLEACADAGIPVTPERLRGYAEAMREVAVVDLDLVAHTEDPAEAMRVVVVGTTMLDPVLVTLRRLAQEAESRRRA